MEGLGVAANVIAVVELSARVISWCYKYSKDVKNARKDIERVQKEITNLKNVAEAVQKLLGGSNGDKLQASQKLLAASVECQGQLQELENTLQQKTRHKTMSRLGLRALKWPFESSDVEKLILDLRRCTQLIQFALQVDQTDVIFGIDERAILNQIPIADGAAFNSNLNDNDTTCLPNTRVQLLEDISRWVNDDRSKPLMWLSGKAGTGKSTISRTIAGSLEAAGHLGATFFFKIGESNRSNLTRFFTTIAADLVLKVPRVRHYIKSVIEMEPDIFRKAAGKQLDTLILQPLLDSQSGNSSHHPIVIVIDALDECERDEDIKLVISLFTKASISQLPYLKFFITSRAELPIRLGFNRAAPETFQHMTLHEIPDTMLEHDILVFLEHHLAEIRIEFNTSDLAQDKTLPSDWPGQEKTQTLLKMSMPLFIFAATVCRFIGQLKYDDPDTQLHTVLEFGTTSQDSHYDKTYLPVLDRLVAGLSGKQASNIIERFRLIVGSLILLATPLSVGSLAKILGIEPRTISHLVGSLHSVIHVPTSPTSELRLFHLSFRDFLLDSDKEKIPFWVDKSTVHANLASRCLILLEKTLKQNNCGMENIAMPRKSLSIAKILECLPAEVQYACSYWVQHVVLAEITLEDNGQVHNFFKVHFLHWLEALSILGKIYDCMRFIKALHGLINPVSGRQILELLDDAQSFLLSNITAIDMAPLQLYSSLLAFAPTESIIRRIYKSTMDDWVTVYVPTETYWGDCLLTLEGHMEGVNWVDISRDSDLIVSASSDGTIRIWSALSGQCIRELENADREIFISAAFSPDASLILSSSERSPIRTWNVGTGECVLEMEKSDGPKTAAVFSHTAELVAAGLTGDRPVVRIWQTATGACVHEFEAAGGVTSVAFSHDSKLIAWGKTKRGLQVWDIGLHICTLSTEASWDVKAVAFSHNSKLLAVGGGFHWADWPATHAGVTVFCLDNGEELYSENVCHNSGIIRSVAFSHDSALLASSLDNSKILLWDADTKENMQERQGHSYGSVNSVVFSQDSALLVSGGQDKTVRIWRTATAAKNDKIVRYDKTDKISLDRYCQKVLVSTDLKSIATMSTRTLRMWNAATGECKWSTDFGKKVLPENLSWKFSPGSVFIILEYLKGLHTQVIRSETGERLDQDPHWQGLTFSPDSTLISCSSYNGILRVWSTVTGECLYQIQRTTSLDNVVLSQDLKLMALHDKDAVTIWHPIDGELHQSTEIKPMECDYFTAPIFSPDSALIALVNIREIHIRRCDTGQIAQILKGHKDPVVGIRFVCGSKFLVSRSNFDEKTIRTWNLETGENLHTIDMEQYYGSMGLSEMIGLRLLTECSAIEPQNLLDDESKIGPVSTYHSCWTPVVGIDPDEGWLTWNGSNVFFLPEECRSRRPQYLSESAIQETHHSSSKTFVVLCDDPPPGRNPTTKIWIFDHFVVSYDL